MDMGWDGFAQLERRGRDVGGDASLIDISIIHMAHVLQGHLCAGKIRDFHVDGEAGGIFFQGDTWLCDVMIAEALTIFILADERHRVLADLKPCFIHFCTGELAMHEELIRLRTENKLFKA